LEFEKRFKTEKDCRDYLYKLRWPDGFICPRCTKRKAWERSDNLYVCAECGHQTSVIAGTIFQGTRKPLKTWFVAIWWITTQKNGASAMGLKQVLGLNSYQTAWVWLHKIRRAMVRPGRDKISGVIEVDETYIGSEESGGKRGRGTENKSIVVLGLEMKGRKFERIRMKVVPDVSSNSLHSFVEEAIAKGSTVITDGWNGYSGLGSKGYVHTVKLNDKNDDDANLPNVHLVVSLLKRWLLGTHQGAVSDKHLQYYLDEFTFRFNRKNAAKRGLLFYRLLEQAVEIEATPYKDMVCKDF
jgi:transposase-like protein